MRRIGFGPAVAPPLFRFRQDAPLKAHPAYRAAKAGDAEAALRVVRDLALAPDASAALAAAFPPGLGCVAPHAIEATGDSAIPMVLAALVARLTDGLVDATIVQSNGLGHRRRPEGAAAVPACLRRPGDRGRPLPAGG